MVMIVDLKNLPCWNVMKIVDYCWKQSIEREKCLNFLYNDNDWEFDIPDEHITWMVLKGYFNG